MPQNGQLIRLNTSLYEDGNAAAASSDAAAGDADSGSDEDDDDDDDDEDDLVQLKSTIQVGGPCVYLDETQDELDYQVDMFSRTLDPRHWKNATNIAKKLKNPKGVKIHTWELMDKAFTFPRVRRYNFVNDNMDMLEHFQDNVNTNITNEVNMERFLRAAQTVKANIAAKYHNGEFDDPANTDPKKEEEKEKTEYVYNWRRKKDWVLQDY